MRWSKVKSLLIVILLIVNVFFAYNIALMRRNETKINSSMKSDVVKLLEDSGIAVADGAISDEKPNLPVLKYVNGESFVRLVSDVLEGGDSYVSFASPTGSTKYIFSSRGDSLEYSESTFAFEFISSSLEIKHPSEFAKRMLDISSVGASSPAGKFCAQAASEYLELLKIGYGKGEYGIEYKIDGYAYVDADSYYVASVKREIGGVETDDSEILMIFTEKELLYMSGVALGGSETERYVTTPYDQLGALLFERDFLRKEGTSSATVASVKPVYYVKVISGMGNFYLVPAWEITYENGRVSMIDAISGERC